MDFLDFEAVKAFVLIVDLQSFTRAAEALDTTQSGVSLKLKRLEKYLGRRLVERTPRLVRVSADGAAFLPVARDLIVAHDRAMGSFSQERQRLALGVGHQVVGSELPRLLGRINDYDPNLTIEFHVGSSGELMEAFDRGNLDAIITFKNKGHRTGGEALFKTQLGWHAAPNWRPLSGQPLPLATQGESCALRALAVRALDDAGIAWTEVFIGQGAATIGAAAAAGLAVVVLSDRVAPHGTVPVGATLGLPPLPTREVVLYSTVKNERANLALKGVVAAFRGTPSDQKAKAFRAG